MLHPGPLGHWGLGIGHSLVIGPWSLVIGPWSLVISRPNLPSATFRAKLPNLMDSVMQATLAGMTCDYDSSPTRSSLLSRLRNLDDDASWRTFFDAYWRLIYNVARKSGLSDDGRWLGVYRPFGVSLYVYRLPGLAQVAQLTHPASLGDFQFSPLGDEVAITSSRVGAEFWNTTTWERTRSLTNFIRVLYTPDARAL